MATNKAARRTIINAWDTLLGVQKETSGLSKEEKERVEASIEALKLEYLALSGLDRNTTYSEITKKLTSSKKKFERIQKDREKLKNGLVTAKKILSAMGAVINLIT